MQTAVNKALPRITVAGATVEHAPASPGVYRFLDAEGNLLYVGKSIDIRARLRSHFARSGQTTRQQRMVNAVDCIECRLTAGEVGALLLENAAIKRELPLFNRRQRSTRRMWSFTLEQDPTGFLRPRLHSYSLERADVSATYGSYMSRYHGRKALTRISREARLCPIMLDLETGRGPCFQYQIKRCAGACVNEESAQQHNRRLLAALESHRLSAWPITTPVLLHEKAAQPHSPAPGHEWHLLHNWSYLGTFERPEDARQVRPGEGFMFERDTYHILRSALGRSDIELVCADTLEPVHWPLRELKP